MKARRADGSPRPSDSGSPLLSVTLKLLMAGRILCFVLLFFAILGAPLYKSVMGGFSGSNAVWRTSLILGLIAVADCWLRTVREPARPDDIESRAFNIWGSPWPRLLFLCVFLFCVNMFVVNMRNPKGWGLVTGNDQPQYYSYLHSWVFDRDLDFANEYELIPGIQEMMEEYHPENPTQNVAPIGTPLLWIPFYLAAHAGVGLLRVAGADVPADGISSPYAAGVGFGSIFMAWLGMLMVYATLRGRFSDRSAFFSTLLLWLATPILWYLTDEVWMSHACSFFVAALVFWLWEKRHTGRTPGGWALLGAAIGLAALVRPSHLVLASLPLADAVLDMRARKPISSSAKDLGLCLACVIATFLPQLLVWWLRTGFHPPPGSPMRWSRPALVPVLFSAHHGLFPWHPVLLLGFVGIVFLWKRSRHFALSLAIVLLLSVYLNASLEGWSGGASFGMRRFVGFLPFMAPGLAAFGSWTVNVCGTSPSVPAAIMVLAIFLYNNLLLVVFREHWISPIDPVSFQTVWATQTALFHESFGNPFSYPANLWFAAQYGVSPSQYDLLGGALPPTDRKIVVQGFRLRPYLGSGWQKSTAASFRHDASFMAVERHCSVLLPLRGGQAYKVEMELALPRGIGQDPSVTLSLNGRVVGVTPLRTDKKMNLKVDFDANLTRDGVNVLGLTFDHLKSERWPDRTTMQGGKGLDARKSRPLTSAAYLSKLTVTPTDG